MKDLYTENYKTLVKETHQETQMSGKTIFVDWKNS